MPPEITDQQLRQMVTEGLSQREISRRLGMARSSLQNRLKRLGLTTGLTPAPTHAAPPLPAPAHESPTMTVVAVADVQEILSTLQQLAARVDALEQPTRAPPAPTHEAPRIPAPTRAGVEQWTVRLSAELIAFIKAEAAHERLPPSHLLEAVLVEWRATRQARQDRRRGEADRQALA